MQTVAGFDAEEIDFSFGKWPMKVFRLAIETCFEQIDSPTMDCHRGSVRELITGPLDDVEAIVLAPGITRIG